MMILFKTVGIRKRGRSQDTIQAFHEQGVNRKENMEGMAALSALRTYQGLELVRGGHKVGLAVDLDQDAQAGPGVDVRRNGALGSHSAGLLVSARETLLAKPLQREGGIYLCIGRLASE